MPHEAIKSFNTTTKSDIMCKCDQVLSLLSTKAIKNSKVIEEFYLRRA